MGSSGGRNVLGSTAFWVMLPIHQTVLRLGVILDATRLFEFLPSHDLLGGSLHLGRNTLNWFFFLGVLIVGSPYVFLSRFGAPWSWFVGLLFDRRRS